MDERTTLSFLQIQRGRIQTKNGGLRKDSSRCFHGHTALLFVHPLRYVSRNSAAGFVGGGARCLGVDYVDIVVSTCIPSRGECTQYNSRWIVH